MAALFKVFQKDLAIGPDGSHIKLRGEVGHEWQNSSENNRQTSMEHSVEMQQGIAIRDAEVEDAALVAALNTDVQAIHAVGLPNLFKEAVLDDALVQEFRANLQKPNSFFLIAALEGKPVGYVFAEFQHRLESARAFANTMLYVHHISVNAEFRGKGIGRALLNEARKRGQIAGINRMALDVWRFNQDARQFFSWYGLEVYNEKMWMDIEPS
jgi:diamine N-acetyltransferase